MKIPAVKNPATAPLKELLTERFAIREKLAGLRGGLASLQVTLAHMDETANLESDQEITGLVLASTRVNAMERRVKRLTEKLVAGNVDVKSVANETAIEFSRFCRGLQEAVRAKLRKKFIGLYSEMGLEAAITNSEMWTKTTSLRNSVPKLFEGDMTTDEDYDQYALRVLGVFADAERFEAENLK